MASCIYYYKHIEYIRVRVGEGMSFTITTIIRNSFTTIAIII